MNTASRLGVRTAEPRAARHWLGVALVVFAWLALGAGLRPLMLPDEGRYVGVAWEMLRSGDWLTPTLDGLPYFHKPPLFYWLTAAALALFGPHEWPARIAPLLGATLAAVSSFAFLRRWAGPRRAELTLAALLAQPLGYVGAQFANLDMLVAGCISATVLLAAHAALCVEHGLPHRGAVLGAYALAALGVLAKGLIGGLLPLLVLLAWLLPQRRWRALRALLSIPGLGVFLLVAGPWFLAMQLRFEGFLHYFFIVQHFQRFAAGGFNNAQPFWFYAALLAVFTLPWWPWFAGLRRTPPPGDAPRVPLRSLMLAWAGVVLVFFSLPQSKLVGYILPALPPLAVLAADGWCSREETAGRRRAWWAGLGLMALLGLGAVLVLALRPGHSTRELALALRAQHAAGQPVLLLAGYDFDLPFYARLAEPMQVVEDWTDPDVQTRDDWRKELADAGRFAPAAAQATLLMPQRLASTLCAQPVSWVVGPADAMQAHPLLRQAQAVASVRGRTLWRVERARLTALRGEERPSAGSPGR